MSVAIYYSISKIGLTFKFALSSIWVDFKWTIYQVIFGWIFGPVLQNEYWIKSIYVTERLRWKESSLAGSLVTYMSPVFPILHIVITVNSWSLTCFETVASIILNSEHQNKNSLTLIVLFIWETRLENGLGLVGDLMHSYTS